MWTSHESLKFLQRRKIYAWSSQRAPSGRVDSCSFLFKIFPKYSFPNIVAQSFPVIIHWFAADLKHKRKWWQTSSPFLISNPVQPPNSASRFLLPTPKFVHSVLSWPPNSSSLERIIPCFPLLRSPACAQKDPCQGWPDKHSAHLQIIKKKTSNHGTLHGIEVSDMYTFSHNLRQGRTTEEEWSGDQQSIQEILMCCAWWRPLRGFWQVAHVLACWWSCGFLLHWHTWNARNWATRDHNILNVV